MDDEALELSLVNDLRELARIAARIDGFCADRRLGPQIGYALNLAVEEILTNTITFGYDDQEPHRIELVVSMEEDAVVTIIVDDSNAFDLSKGLDSDIESAVESENLADLGLFLVHRMMDSVGYRRIHGCNVVTLTKNAAPARTQEPPDQA